MNVDANALISSFKDVESPSGNEEINEKYNDTIIQCLRWLDTIHDFYPVNSSGRGEDIRGILNRRYNNDISFFMESISSDRINKITPSSVEKQTELFYNKNFNTINIGEHIIDVKTITDKYKANETITAAEILKEIAVPDYSNTADLQLSLSKDRSIFKTEMKATNFLANVILTFFFGEDIHRDVYVLIDAAFGRLDCMLQDIDQISTLVNVLTIGDSAVTNANDVVKTKTAEKQQCGVEDYNNKFKRKVYLANPNTIPYNDNDKKYRIESNEFTKTKFDVWYQDADLEFSKQNNASARLYVKEKTEEGKTWFSEFSFLSKNSPNSGASVGTLKQLIIIINGIDDTKETRDNAKKAIFNFYKYETQFNLTPILCGMLDTMMSKDEIINFLYDYKRAGDHEQVNSANFLYKKGVNVILLTGDRLCSLYARLIEQPCIYIHDGNYDMYRFLREATKAQTIEQALNKLQVRKLFILGEIMKIDKDKIISELSDLKGQIQKSNDLKSDFENSLYSFVFMCLLEKIERMIGKCNNYINTTELLNNYITTEVNPLLDIPPTELDETDLTEIEEKIKALNENYNVFYNKNKELFEFALYYLKEKEVSKDKFKSKALDYDNAMVIKIIKFFYPYIGEIKPKYRGSYTADIKKNIINRIAEDFGEIVNGDFLSYLKKCLLYRGVEINDDNNLIEDDRITQTAIKNGIQEIWNNRESIEEDTYDTYKPIFDGIIKDFMIKKIDAANRTEVKMDTAPETGVEEEEPEPEIEIKPELKSETVLEPERDTSMEVDTEAPEEEMDTSMEAGGKNERKLIIEKQNELFKIMKISLYEWFWHIVKNNLTTTGLSTDIVQNLTLLYKNKFTNSKFISYFQGLQTANFKIYKEREQFDKLSENKEEHESIYANRREIQENEDKDLDIKINFFDEFIDIELFKHILNYRLTYEYYLFYGTNNYIKQAQIETDYIKPLLESYYENIQLMHARELVDNYFYTTKTTDEKEKINAIESEYEYVDTLYEPHEKEYQHHSVYSFLYKGIIDTQLKETHIGIIRHQSIKEASKKSTIHNIKQRRTSLQRKQEQSREALIANQRGLVDITNSQPSKRYSREGTPEGSKSMGRSKIASRRKLFNIGAIPEELELGGGKRTRKHKNKRNKKTRHRNKKTLKNKTLKKRKEKRKHRTRRN